MSVAASLAGPSGFVTDVRCLALTTPGRRQTTGRAERRAAGEFGRRFWAEMGDGARGPTTSATDRRVGPVAPPGCLARAGGLRAAAPDRPLRAAGPGARR